MRRAALLLALLVAIAIASPAQTFTTLYSFCTQEQCTDGANPYSTLVQDSHGNFYGTTSYGGDHAFGTVFKITPDGTLTTLYSFCSQQNCADGMVPFAGLVQATDGNFYGTTYEGGAYSVGVVFEITPEGALTPLHSFQYLDGYQSNAPLIQATDGNLYGTAGFGGANGQGTIFKVTLEGTLNVLYNFCQQTGCSDGRLPQATIVQATDGNFYGTTTGGGAYCTDTGGCGTVFKITPQGALTTLYSFCAQENCADGTGPVGGLVRATDGNLYGTTEGGGAQNYGTVFRITPEGTLTTLHSFDSTDGAFPYAGLVQATDGNFYGTTYAGGAYQPFGQGTVFKITPEGTLTTLHSFDTSDGNSPIAGLVQAMDGNFYGTTVSGGTYSGGTVFRLVAYAVLSVNKSGMGTVISGDGHIYCGSVCAYTYNGGAQVGLTAIPAPGYTFDGFTGCDNVQNGVCLVQMSSAKNVTATFTTSNVGLTSLVLNPSSVKGGNISIATITLNAPAPPGGLGVGVATNSPLAVHPPSLVLVPEGRTSWSFAVRTSPVRVTTMANVVASAGASQVNATLTVTTGYGSSQLR